MLTDLTVKEGDLQHIQEQEEAKEPSDEMITASVQSGIT